MQNMHTTFAALGDPTRFMIVSRLLAEGELPVGEIQKDATVSAPALSRHLKVLRSAGVVSQRVDAQRRIYSIRPDAVQTIHNWTLSHKEFWQASLDRLEMALLQERNK